MSDPVQWPNAAITWSRENGYTLRLPLWADSRVLDLREDRVRKAINRAMAGRTQVITTIFAMEVESNPRETNAEPGAIVISTQTMITASEATELRAQIEMALDGAVEEAEDVLASEEAAAEAVLSILRRPET